MPWINKEDFNLLIDKSIKLDAIEAFLGKPPENFKGNVVDLLKLKFQLIEKSLGIKTNPPEKFTRFEWILMKALEAVLYRDKYFRKVDDSLSDPFIDTVRELMPDEIEQIKQRSQDLMNGNGLHQVCATTNLCLISTIVRQSKSDAEQLQQQMSALQTTD